LDLFFLFVFACAAFTMDRTADSLRFRFNAAAAAGIRITRSAIRLLNLGVVVRIRDLHAGRNARRFAVSTAVLRDRIQAERGFMDSARLVARKAGM
jgi:hypothetical protein